MDLLTDEDTHVYHRNVLNAIIAKAYLKNGRYAEFEQALQKVDSYELRRTTAYRVYTAELDIFILERNTHAIQYQKWTLAFLIENPILE